MNNVRRVSPSSLNLNNLQTSAPKETCKTSDNVGEMQTGNIKH